MNLSRICYTQSEKRSIFILVFILLVINTATLIGKRKYEFSLVEPQKKKVTKIELNSADSLVLLDLRGIGPYYASRIIKFRNLLGGYHSKDQMLQVYGMDSTRYELFKDQIVIDTSRLARINLRTVSFKGLLRHPYVSYDMVKSFVRYRDQYGPPDGVSEVWEHVSWPDSVYRLLNPYLSVN